MKKILLIGLLVVLMIVLSSCGNRQTGLDTYQTFKKAHILLNGEWREINIKAWRDFENGDEVQVVTPDGKVYLTHYMNVVLVNE